jgi:hypothetical protein
VDRPRKTTLGVGVPRRADSLPPGDREEIGRWLRGVEDRFNARLNGLELEIAAKPPESSIGRRNAAFWANAGAVLMGLGACIAAASQCSKPPPPELKAAQVYDTVKGELDRLARVQGQQHDDLVQLRAWLSGYFKATGVRVADPPGTPAAPPLLLSVEPSPAASVSPVVVKRPGSAPKPAAVRVLKPLPSPAPSARAPSLPAAL